MIIAAVGAPKAEGRIRPVDPGRDLGAIADLIEIAFSAELDRSGTSLVADLRQLAVLGPLLTIVDYVAPFAGGYVWEQNGRVIGNVTVTLEDASAQRWFISNVAVHPQYQGHGIGRRLMDGALGSIRRQGGRQATLQVRTDNEPAQRLYRSLGFKRFDTLVEMLRPGALPLPQRPDLPLHRLKNRDWTALLDLARAATPPEVLQVRPLQASAFRPTLLKRIGEWFDRFLGTRQTWRWGLEQEGRLAAVVSVLVQDDSYPARLDLAVRPEARGSIEGPLADYGLAALERLHPRPVAANASTTHPEAITALCDRHFFVSRTLDQLILESL